MNKLKEIWHSAPVMSRIAFWLCLLASIGLLVAGFVCPPLAEIHNSVLTAVGELFGFASLGLGYYAIDKGMKAVIEHNDTKVTINKEKGVVDGEGV